MHPRLFASTLAWCGLSFVVAQPNPDPTAGEPVHSLPPIFTPRAPLENAIREGSLQTVASAPAPRRGISPDLAAKLSAIAIRAVPPADPSRSEGVATTAPQRDFSGVVQLKPYIVHEDRVPRLRERDVLTAKGKLALARRRYPGLGRLGDAESLRRLEEDFALERRQEAADLQSLLESAGAKPTRDVKRKIDEAVTRPIGLPTEISGPFRLPK